MPFKSKSQWRMMGAKMARGEISKARFDEWARKSPKYGKLPNKVKSRRTK